jgi:hypothetical protein
MCTGVVMKPAEIEQNDARYIAAGQPVEITFKFEPGVIRTGKVETVLQAIATGQAQTSGVAVAPKEIAAAPFVVRVRLRRRRSGAAPVGRRHRHGCDLYRGGQADPYHPKGVAAADRDPQLRQSVLTRREATT